MRRSLLAALCLALAALGAQAAPVAADTNPTCSTPPSGSGPFSPTWHRWRNTNTYTDMTATAYIRTLEACPNPPAGTSGASMVLPVNMVDNDCQPFIQLGWGELVDGRGMRWLWTPSATSCGVLIESSGAISPASLVGEKVRFRIRDVTENGEPMWRVAVSVLTGPHAGDTAFVEYVPRGDGVVDEVWAGIEIKNWNSQFGGTFGSKVTIFDMGYVTASTPGTWFYMTDSGGTACNPAWANTRGSTVPSWVVENHINSYDGDEAIGCAITGYTSSH